jgi:predicted metal-binding membrane protein
MAWPGIRDRRIPALMLAALTALAWWALWAGQDSPWGHSLLHGGHAMAMPMSPAGLAGTFVLGWTLMTIAMMLPTSAPLILLFHRLVSGRSRAGWLVASLVAGYLGVWAAFGLALHLAMQALRSAAERIIWLDRNPWAAGAAILLCAGLYQFSPLKYACLDKCRSPMMFLMGRWRGIRPAREAFRLGTAHGAYCLGCCWSLMTIMFVAGMGSFAWMLVLGVAMGAEKNFPWGRRLSPVLGVLLVAAALAAIALAKADRP